MTRNVLMWLEYSEARRPDVVAFSDEFGELTYRALLRRAKAIGTAIASFVAPQSPVLIFAEKGTDCVAAMLGAVYAGCFYTPVDCIAPDARLEKTIAVLQPACVLCQDVYLSKAQALTGENRVIALSEISEAIDEEVLLRIRQNSIDTDLLYVLFTSGSTGLPKGVAITHRSVIDFIEWARVALALDETVCFGNQAPVYFDNSILDIYGALSVGAKVDFIPRRFFSFPGKLMRYVMDQSINTLFWVPSVLTSVVLSGALDTVVPSTLTRVYFCGEVMPCRTLNAWRRTLPQASFVNMYGPTEITDVCTYFPVDRAFEDDDTLPIGFPCQNTRIDLIDSEICVSGTCLSPGYYNAPEKTKEVFVQHPLRPHVQEIIYKTGDLGAYNQRGELMFLGRKDNQIKRHGYRIELGEIESAVVAIPGMSACCLYDIERERIICVVTGKTDEKELRRALKQRLPKYMLPDVFIYRQELPTLGNGKIDRVRVRREWNDEYSVT